ncbi:MAG TPA: PIG-L family deacetylase [Candidatus Sulfotelmatobacter sp.]|nr:PIG-L family deacetylase [Candidatus Sulfotelmatobacter sp.]
MRHSGPLGLARRVVRPTFTNFQSSSGVAQTTIHFGLMFCLVVAMGAQNGGEVRSAVKAAPPKPAPTKPAAASFASASAAELVDPRFAYSGVPAELPQDRGTAGLRLALRRLGTTARLMQVVAHPDDEDGGMLTLEARGRGVSTLLMTLNRGEGGQNKIGSNLSDVLGVLRAEELLASDEYYGVQERFSRVADFGFSKSPEETFQKWGGHDVALGDMVRVIRTFRPDVLVARFSGTERDGHGHHQASSILAKEAFRAAADPKRFPEQISEGLQPWQAKKFYTGNVCGFGAMTCPDANWTVKLNTGEESAALGMGYVQFAMDGLRHQLSQGAANWTIDSGDRFTFYKLVDSVVPAKLDKDGHEKDFFDGLDTSLPALAARLGTEETKAAGLRKELTEIAKEIGEANQGARGNDVSAAAVPLVRIVQRLEKLGVEVRKSGLAHGAKADLLMRLDEKLGQAETALNLALNVSLQAVVESSGQSDRTPASLPKDVDALTTVSPGQEFLVAVKFHNGSRLPLTVDALKLEVPAGWNTISERIRPEVVKAGDELRVTFRLRVPKDAAYTRPYWHRDDPETESINHIDNEKYATLPFPPPALRARVKYGVTTGVDAAAVNAISAVVVTPFLDDAGKERSRPLAVVPAFSVMVEPGTQVISTHNGSSSTVTVGVTSNLAGTERGVLKLELPEGWKSEPAEQTLELAHRGEKKEVQFKVFPAGMQEGRATLRAVLDVAGAKYSEGYTLVTREDLGSFYYYQPARQRVSMVDVRAPHDLKVGYVMGAGDDIPTVLAQVGMDVTLISPEKLASEDLSKFGTVVLGIRAFDTQKDVVAYHQKLLDFVSAGGTLVVQYNAGVGDFNSGHFTPYSAELSRARVSVEEAPVEILAPEDPVFHYPNTITAHDFEGWVQERGLYFMDKWDDRFQPLLASHDPGEDPQKGGLLKAQSGKGIYIYTGYAFFRQLPAGVPGAVRLYVNLLSAKGSG